MRIAIDLSPLQNAHRMRGIGYTLINFINNLPADVRLDNEFIFYVLPEGEPLFADPFEALNLDNVRYETRTLKLTKRIRKFGLPGRLNIFVGVVNRALRFHSFYYGDSRVSDLSGVDVFLQADQNHALPHGRGFKKILIIYDLIPQILEWDYLLTYRTARLQGKSRLKSFVLDRKRRLLINKTRANTRKADRLIAISEHTKKDFVKLLKVPAKKIEVIPLGVSEPETGKSKPVLRQYVKTGWGYAKRPLSLDPKIPFLLFIGGVDSRRKMEDLVAAFNNLRAQGHMLKLVLAGDIMLGPSAITTEKASEALGLSSYLDDVIFMGFTDDDTKSWLYANALVYVFPSRYEGFGLPVLEAMIHGCPVISYRNAAVSEVAGNTPLYADDLKGLMDRIVELLGSNQQELDNLRKKGTAAAKKYDWSRTATGMMKVITRK